MANRRPQLQVRLIGKHASTGNTRHFRDGKQISAVSSLQIREELAGGGFYLLYMDANDEELTDTLHPSIEDAMEQARFEFNVEPDEWTTMV